MIFHFTEKIPISDSLLQYSISITKYMHYVSKDAYRGSNEVDSLSKVVITYTSDDTFALLDLSFRAQRFIQQ